MQTIIPTRGSVIRAQQLETRKLQRSFTVDLEHGLHARPCALLIKTLRPFSSEVLVEANGEQVSGHSIMGLMMLAAGLGCRITFTITGPDALQAMAAVEHLFATRFAEAYGLSRGTRRATTL
ncbi:MAG TPA: HPr family phosphocarrier protein [Verrucomicrobiae bacterium]|nr:HPr family phosphocarrier protein [Verrucomicrobiae bacterium]